METAMPYYCSGADLTSSRFGGAVRNCLSTVGAARPYASLKLQCCSVQYEKARVVFRKAIIGPDECRTRKETKVRYAPRSNSLAEAQSRFDASNSNAQVSKQENKAVMERRNRDGEDSGGQQDNLEDFKMTRVCDRLIEVFMVEKTTPGEWRKLLAFSEEWAKIRPHFFQRCRAHAESEADPKRRGDLLKLARQLKEVDEDMIRHGELLEEIEQSESGVDAIVGKRRKDFTGDFFGHLRTLCDVNYKNTSRRDEIAAVARKCLFAIESHDAAQEDAESLSEAQLKFDDILKSPSLEAAANKIDKLAQRQELDSSLMLLITKAWAAAKESTMMKEEVKDIMLHLYNAAMGNMQRLVCKEVRIIRYLLSIQDPHTQLAAVKEAFTPGVELEGKDEDVLYTTPEKLHNWIKIVLDAYRTDKQSTLVKEAQKLMNPEVISRVEVLKKILEDQFL